MRTKKFTSLSAFINDTRYAEFKTIAIFSISDSKVKGAMDNMKTEAKSDYKIIFANCGTAVSNAFIPAGLRNGNCALLVGLIVAAMPNFTYQQLINNKIDKFILQIIKYEKEKAPINDIAHHNVCFL